MADLPDFILEVIFCHLHWKDLVNCSIVCKHWKVLLEEKNCKAWHTAHLRLLSNEDVQTDLDLLNMLIPREKAKAILCRWTESTISPNMCLQKNKFTIYRKPVPQSTDAGRSKVGFANGVHQWLVRWEGPRFGSSACVGVCTEEATLHTKGYTTLLGDDDRSWAWDLVNHTVRHEGSVTCSYPRDRPGNVSIVTLMCIVN